MTTTQLPTTVNYRVPAEFYGDYVDDFDTEAIDAEVLDKLNRYLPNGITVTADGSVFAEVELVEIAGIILWHRLVNTIDLDPILDRHRRALLDWESADTDTPGDQNADTTLVAHGYWSLGRGLYNAWNVTLIEQDAELEVTGYVDLGRFGTEEEAKAAAEARERSGSWASE